MKKQSVSQRNFIGAFLGGVLGILGFGCFKHPIALPFGCLLGVIVGWWFKEICQSTMDSLRRGVELVQNMSQRLAEFSGATRGKIGKIRFDFEPCRRFLISAGSWLVWLSQRPAAFINMRVHPVSQAIIARIFVVLAYLAINALWIVPFSMHCQGMTQKIPNPNYDGLLGLYIIAYICELCVILTAPLICMADDETPRMKKFYRLWERYTKDGPGRFFVKELFRVSLTELKATLLLGGALLWFAGAGALFLVFVVAPISILVGAAKGIYGVSTRAGHWLCFVVTVIVTALIARIAHPHIANTMVLWIAALVAGLASAGATEAVRKIFLWAVSANGRARLIVSEDLTAQLAPSGRAFWSITKATLNRLQGSLEII